MSDSNEGRALSRRNLLVLGAGAGLMSACGSVASADGGNGGDAMNADDAVTSDDAMNTDDAMSMDDTGAVTCTGPGIQLGTVADYPEGTWTLEGTARAIVAHDAGGLYAYSNICTHEGCTLSRPTSRGVTTCPCHRSQFDGDGAVIIGPAVRPLAHYEVNVCDGNVFVNRARTVAATTRTPV